MLMERTREKWRKVADEAGSLDRRQTTCAVPCFRNGPRILIARIFPNPRHCCRNSNESSAEKAAVRIIWYYQAKAVINWHVTCIGICILYLFYAAKFGLNHSTSRPLYLYTRVMVVRAHVCALVNTSIWFLLRWIGVIRRFIAIFEEFVFCASRKVVRNLKFTKSLPEKDNIKNHQF